MSFLGSEESFYVQRSFNAQILAQFLIVGVQNRPSSFALYKFVVAVTRRNTYVVYTYLSIGRALHTRRWTAPKKLVVIVLQLVVAILHLGVVGADHTQPVWAEPCIFEC